MFGSFCVFGHLLGMFWFALYCYGTYVCYQQIFVLLKNRSVEKIWDFAAVVARLFIGNPGKMGHIPLASATLVLTRTRCL